MGIGFRAGKLTISVLARVERVLRSRRARVKGVMAVVGGPAILEKEGVVFGA